MKILVIIPTYNEADNIQTLIPDLLALGLPLDVLVVDDNSPDHTAEIVRRFSEKDPRVHLIERPSKLGLGTAHIRGFQYALSSGFDAVISMDADYSHHPRFVPQLVKGLDHADVVIGSRYVDGGEVVNCKWGRKKISHTANGVARAVLGWRIHDATAGFRVYRIGVLKSIDIETIFSGGYSFLVETLYRCYVRKFRILEVPITFKDRFAGKSKLSSHEIRLAVYTILRLGGGRITKGFF